jgi:two-component system CheB/CheR fusion protein
VTDTGIGMDAATINHIFEPFTQADRSIERSHGGLGLGLALAKGLIEQHGGKMSAESAGSGCGSRFMFTLPRSVPTHHPAIPARPARPAQPQRVLLIEDNLDTAESLKMLLELSGHIVTVAHSGNEGIEQARRQRPQVVVCDIGLPGANGYDVARALRSDPENHSTYMIAMTGYGRAEDKRMAIAAGFDQHLTKPIAIDALEHLLTRG